MFRFIFKTLHPNKNHPNIFWKTVRYFLYTYTVFNFESKLLEFDYYVLVINIIAYLFVQRCVLMIVKKYCFSMLSALNVKKRFTV